MMEKILEKIKKNIKVSYVILFIVLLVYTVSLLTPLFWTLLTSFKNVDDWNWALAQKDASGVVWTKSFEFTNYVEAYKNFYVERVRGGLNYRFYITDMFVNSILYAGGN